MMTNKKTSREILKVMWHVRTMRFRYCEFIQHFLQFETIWHSEGRTLFYHRADYGDHRHSILHIYDKLIYCYFCLTNL